MSEHDTEPDVCEDCEQPADRLIPVGVNDEERSHYCWDCLEARAQGERQ